MLNSFFDKYIFTSTLKYSNNNFNWMNVPFVIMPVDVLVLISSVEESEKVKEIYYYFKESTKKYFLPRFNEAGLDDFKKLDLIKTFFVASGFGKIEIIDLDKDGKKAIMILENSPFALALKGKAKKPVDNIIRGIFAGIFCVIFKQEIDCVESECFALNAKTCKFIIKPINEFDVTSKLVQEQLILE